MPRTVPLHRLTPPRWVLQAVELWPGADQRQARRNALVAATTLARQRLDRLEVEAYLASRPARPEPVTGRLRSSA
ncbi:MAG TPA: hypothetical protein VER39_11295 [Nocardioidaceae bacterium]|nr:hypothetical protein [Nocardioidaceae bacterium]